ncbi:hypothetical protein [Kitasatospora sp. NPDC101183]|uniref:hypothetical protein n=1 Tax=Kitasatospora sp. NPDC101183 TaxID=3364100 RepID=UPI0038180FFE
MGVLTDYFRAPDAAVVVRELEAREGFRPDFDGVQAKRIDPGVVLGGLVAALNGEPWRVDLVEETLVWPTESADPADQQDGPWVTELGDATRDTLAGADEGRLPAAVEEWSRSEELDGADPSDLLPLAEELIALARRAREAGERLYCWICL